MSAPLTFYNEIDPDAANVLRALIDDGVIAPGVVDTRSIKDLTPDDLAGYTQVHFFAGGGLWSVAARLARWPDDRPLWTGSCPCQPFSAAGKGGGVDDPRHLWPDFFRLIRACRPPVVMGEQVAGAPGYGWFDGVRSDLAGEDYASRCVDIPACAVDAPHIRQRLYWIAVGDAERRGQHGARLPDGERQEVTVAAGADGREPVGAAFGVVNAPRVGRGEGRPEHELRSGRPALAGADAQGVTLGDAFGPRLEGQPRHEHGGGGRPGAAGSVAAADGSGLDVADADPRRRAGRQEDAQRGSFGRDADERSVDGDGRNLADADQPGPLPAAHAGIHREAQGERPRHVELERHASVNGSFWSDAEWLACHDGKARRTQPGLRLLVDGLPGRVGLWRIAGNAIVAPLAAEVIRAFLDVEEAA